MRSWPGVRSFMKSQRWVLDWREAPVIHNPLTLVIAGCSTLPGAPGHISSKITILLQNTVEITIILINFYSEGASRSSLNCCLIIHFWSTSFQDKFKWCCHNLLLASGKALLLSLRFLVLSQIERIESEDEGERGYTGCMDEGIICIRTNNVHLYKQPHAQYEWYSELQGVHRKKSINQYDCTE